MKGVAEDVAAACCFFSVFGVSFGGHCDQTKIEVVSACLLQRFRFRSKSENTQDDQFWAFDTPQIDENAITVRVLFQETQSGKR